MFTIVTIYALFISLCATVMGYICHEQREMIKSQREWANEMIQASDELVAISTELIKDYEHQEKELKAAHISIGWLLVTKEKLREDLEEKESIQ